MVAQEPARGTRGRAKTSAPLYRDEFENALLRSGAIAKEQKNERLSQSVQKLLHALPKLRGQKGFLEVLSRTVGSVYVLSRRSLYARLGEHGPAFEKAHHAAQEHLLDLLEIKQPLKL